MTCQVMHSAGCLIHQLLSYVWQNYLSNERKSISCCLVGLEILFLKMASELFFFSPRLLSRYACPELGFNKILLPLVAHSCLQLANWTACRGHIVGHVKNIGHNVDNPTTRVYATPLAQPWHNDSVRCVYKPGVCHAACQRHCRYKARASSSVTGARILLLQADIVALLCLKQAKEGGLSSWSSSISVHNQVLLHGRSVHLFDVHLKAFAFTSHCLIDD